MNDRSDSARPAANGDAAPLDANATSDLDAAVARSRAIGRDGSLRDGADRAPFESSEVGGVEPSHEEFTVRRPLTRARSASPSLSLRGSMLDGGRRTSLPASHDRFLGEHGADRGPVGAQAADEAPGVGGAENDEPVVGEHAAEQSVGDDGGADAPVTADAAGDGPEVGERAVGESGADDAPETATPATGTAAAGTAAAAAATTVLGPEPKPGTARAHDDAEYDADDVYVEPTPFDGEDPVGDDERAGRDVDDDAREPDVDDASAEDAEATDSDADARDADATRASASPGTIEIDRSADDSVAFAPLRLSEPAPARPVAPKPASNRGVACVVALLGTIVFAALFLVAFVLLRAIYTENTDLVASMLAFLPTAAFYVPVCAFGVFFVLWAVVSNRAGSGSYAVAALFGAVVAALGYHVGVALQLAINEGFAAFSPLATLTDPEHLPASLVAALFAALVIFWFGTPIAARGRRLAARARVARRRYEQERAQSAELDGAEREETRA